MNNGVVYRGFVFEDTQQNDREADPGFPGFWIYKAGRLSNPWGHGETVEECQEICDGEIDAERKWIVHAYRDILEKAFYAGGEACRGDGYNGERFDAFFKEITQ